MKHVKRNKTQTFCGKSLDSESIAPAELEHAQENEVCHICISQAVEVAACDEPAKYEAFCWMDSGQVIKESLATLWGVWAYRLMMQRLSKSAGRTIENFTYSKHA